MPRRFETRVLEEIASLSAAQLIDAKELVAGQAESTDVYDRFLKLDQRCSALQSALSSLGERFADLAPPSEEGRGSPKKPRVSTRIQQTDLKRTLDVYESTLNDLNTRIDRLLGDVEELEAVRGKLSMLRLLNIRVDALGVHTFTVVRVGQISSQALPGLDDSLVALSATHEETRTNADESLIAIVAPRKNEERLGDLLARSGFREIYLPPGLDPDPKTAQAELEDRIRRRLRESAELQESLRQVAGELAARAEYVNFLREATSVVSRTENLSVAEGWIIESAVQDLRQRVAAITSDSYYFQAEDPKPGEQTPVLLPRRGWLMSGFELLTTVRGMPSYGELDPTIVFAVLFPIMYGMMFGDVGDGAVILVLGLLLYRRKKGFIGFSAHSMRSLGTIMVVSGLSAMVFGVFYGSVFLTHSLFRPLLFQPISAFGTIVEVALAFGVAQLAISLVLNIANKVAAGEWVEAVFSGKGVIGLCYYLLGIILAVHLIQGGLQLSLFYSPENMPITSAALLCLLLVFLSPLLRHLRTGGRHVGGYVIDGFGELLEVFISFLTNSLSYVRLAAFALAHSIFAGFASDLGSTIGFVSSFVLVNALVISVDGFAAGIQSVRLLYYEFSTKFFAASGERFKPLSLKLTEGS